eukprot:269611-Lingulodinium_polyedra.AAC.1
MPQARAAQSLAAAAPPLSRSGGHGWRSGNASGALWRGRAAGPAAWPVKTVQATVAGGGCAAAGNGRLH